MLGATVLSTPTIRLVEPAPPPNIGDSAAALLANESASSSSLLMIAWIIAGVFAAACACMLLVHMVQRHRHKQRAKKKVGERRPPKKRKVDSGVETNEDPQAIIAASETVCREVMRDSPAAEPALPDERAPYRAPPARPLDERAPYRAPPARPLDVCFEVPGTITEQMTQGVKNQVLSQLPEGVQFDDFYPEAVLSYARARRRLRALRTLAKRAGSGTEDAGDVTSPLQRI
jgi:hypothetical protein